MRWAIYSKKSNEPVWFSENFKDLMAAMVELNGTLGDKFYIETYPLRGEYVAHLIRT